MEEGSGGGTAKLKGAARAGIIWRAGLLNNFTLFGFISITAVMLTACERSGVYASSDADIYQPRRVQVNKFYNKYRDEMKGELIRVDLTAKTIAVQIENGLVQTFKFDENTTVAGLENQPQTEQVKLSKVRNPSVQNLAGKEGSEVTVHWKDQSEAKIATHIDVDQIYIAKRPRRGRR
jgi:hypothetical protein